MEKRRKGELYVLLSPFRIQNFVIIFHCISFEKGYNEIASFPVTYGFLFL